MLELVSRQSAVCTGPGSEGVMGDTPCFLPERKEGEEIEEDWWGFFPVAAVVTEIGLSSRWPSLKWISSRGTWSKTL